MLKFFKLVFIMMILMSANVFAEPYPDTLENGNLVLVDGGMGVGRYAARSSVVVGNYAPPKYQLAIEVYSVTFSEDYWQAHHTYIGSPYNIQNDPIKLHFRYDWNQKNISFSWDGTNWSNWDINSDHSHADGDPLVPNSAEVAFVSAYNMRFFDAKAGYSPILKKNVRVIDESLYRALGI